MTEHKFKSFTFRAAWMDAIERLSPEYQPLALRWIVRYGLDGTLPDYKTEDPDASMAYGIVMAVAAADLDKGHSAYEKRAAAGKLGGRPKVVDMVSTVPVTDTEQASVPAPAPVQKSTPATDAASEDTDDLPTRDEIIAYWESHGLKGARVEGRIPTLDEVAAYWAEKDLKGDPVRFYQYRAEHYWLDGKGQPINRWRIMADRWAAYEREGKAQPTGSHTASQTAPAKTEELVQTKEIAKTETSTQEDSVYPTDDEVASVEVPASWATQKEQEVAFELIIDSDDLPF